MTIHMQGRRWVAFLLCVAMAGLAACGGGGGGDGGGGGGNNFTIKLDKNAVAIDAETQGSGAVQVSGTAVGTVSGTIFVDVTADAPGVSSIGLQFTGLTFVATVTADTSLPVGIYSGRLQVMVCADVQCSTRLAGSPLFVPFTVRIHPPFSVTPAVVAIDQVSGTTPAPIDVAVQLPFDSTSYEVRLGTIWLALLSQSPTGFRLQPNSVPVGTYDAGITVVTNTGSSRSFVLNYTSRPPAGGQNDLLVDRNSISLSATEGAVSAAADLGVTPPSWKPALHAQVDYAQGTAGWLNVVPRAGGYALSGDASGLSAGNYLAQLTITGDAFTAGKVIDVALTVGSGLVRPANATLEVTATTLAASLTGSTPITVAGGPTRTWTAVSDATWLVLDNLSGATGSVLTWHIDPAILPGMANGSSLSATVSMTVDSPVIAGKQFQVTLSKRLPDVQWITPAIIPAGKASTVTVRGMGFNALTDPAASLSATGLNVAVTRVTDTELLVSVPAVNAGQHVLSIGNALGLPTSTRPLAVVASGPYGYAYVPQLGLKRGQVYDLAHEQIYTVNADQTAVVRWRYVNGAWTQQLNRAIAGLVEIGLAPDASVLVANTQDGRVLELDPLTLTTVSEISTGLTFGAATAMAGGLPVTNDGKVWLAADRFSVGTLYTYDLGTRAATPYVVDPALDTLFYQGPYAQVSRNGERMLISQTDRSSPSPALLYLDARDSVMHANPAGQQHFSTASLSDNGQRVLLSNFEVFDATFNLIGRPIVTDASRFAVASALSPDGSRAYMLAYGNNYDVDQTSVLPRVYVFDSSQSPPGGSTLPLLGSFDVPDYASCPSNVALNCTQRPTLAIAPDGRTLFAVGPAALQVIPVPTELRANVARVPGQQIQQGSKTKGIQTGPAGSGVRRWPQ